MTVKAIMQFPSKKLLHIFIDYNFQLFSTKLNEKILGLIISSTKLKVLTIFSHNHK